MTSEEPPHHEISVLLPSVTKWKSKKDRIARAKMLWYELRGMKVPEHIFVSADITVEEYEEYVLEHYGKPPMLPNPTYKLQDILDKVYPNFSERTKKQYLKGYCESNNVDLTVIKKATFDQSEFENFCSRLNAWTNPKSRRASATKAGKVSSVLRYARGNPDDFRKYVNDCYKGKVRDSISVLWRKIQDQQTEFKKLPDNEKELIYGAMKSFHDKKKSLVASKTARKAK